MVLVISVTKISIHISECQNLRVRTRQDVTIGWVLEEVCFQFDF